MSAARIVLLAAYPTDGGPADVAVVERPVPRPAPGEVLVEVVAAGVNPVDAWIRGGALAAVLPPPPFGLGYDLAGTVTALGDGVDSLSVGTPVLGTARFPAPAGTFATHVTVPAHELAVRPAQLDPVTAGALPLVALTALQTLDGIAGLRRGQRVLVHGAAGGVGHIAVQLARHRGAHVTGTAGPANLDYLRGLGVDVVVDHTAGPVEDALAGELFDVVLDPVDRADLVTRSIPLVRPGGIVVAITHEPHDEDLAARRGVSVRRFMVQPSGPQVAEAAALAADGVLRPLVTATHPLGDAAAALDAVAAGRGRGKRVLLTA